MLYCSVENCMVGAITDKLFRETMIRILAISGNSGRHPHTYPHGRSPAAAGGLFFPFTFAATAEPKSFKTASSQQQA